MTAAAANCLLTEAIWNRVRGAHLAPDSASARPPASSRTADPARVTVAARGDVATVSLVGYTNAGKSTLMNALTDAGVLVEDKLFATLDTRTRRWQFRGGGHVLLSATFGFTPA